MKYIIFLLAALLLTSCAIENPGNPEGYKITLIDGSIREVDYEYCVVDDGGVFSKPDSLFVVCGDWTTPSRWDSSLDVKYSAQIISLEEK